MNFKTSEEKEKKEQKVPLPHKIKSDNYWYAAKCIPVSYLASFGKNVLSKQQYLILVSWFQSINMAAIIIPRNFKLLEEVCKLGVNVLSLHFSFSLSSKLEASEKGTGDMSVSMGLVNSDDIFLTEWQGSIMGPHGVTFFQLA